MTTDVFLFFAGWALILLAAVLFIVLVFKSTGCRPDPKNTKLVAVMSACYVVGCLLLTRQQYEYLYIINTLAAGEALFYRATEKPRN
jgi:hypothetical protein